MIISNVCLKEFSEISVTVNSEKYTKLNKKFFTDRNLQTDIYKLITEIYKAKFTKSNLQTEKFTNRYSKRT